MELAAADCSASPSFSIALIAAVSTVPLWITRARRSPEPAICSWAGGLSVPAAAAGAGAYIGPFSMRTTIDLGMLRVLSPMVYSTRPLRSCAESAWMRSPFLSTMVSVRAAAHNMAKRQNVIIDFKSKKSKRLWHVYEACLHLESNEGTNSGSSTGNSMRGGADCGAGRRRRGGRALSRAAQSFARRERRLPGARGFHPAGRPSHLHQRWHHGFYARGERPCYRRGV